MTYEDFMSLSDEAWRTLVLALAFATVVLSPDEQADLQAAERDRRRARFPLTLPKSCSV